MAIEQSLRVVPKLADAPDRFDSALLELSVFRAQPDERPHAGPDTSHESMR